MKRLLPTSTLPLLALAALAIAAVAGLTDWALVMPDEPLVAWASTVIAGCMATAFTLLVPPP